MDSLLLMGMMRAYYYDGVYVCHVAIRVLLNNRSRMSISLDDFYTLDLAILLLRNWIPCRGERL
jgi:hypothetical protein